MVRRCGSWIALASLLLLLMAWQSAAVPLTVLYTNDLHLRFARLDSIARLISQERASGAAVLLVDAGDAWHDFRLPTTAVWGADRMVEWMNRVGYDAMALGNHDLYWGSARLAELAAAMEFPLLCANLQPIRPEAAVFSASTTVVVGGVSVRIVGLTAEELLPYSAYPGLRAVPAASALRRELEAATEPAQLRLVIGHLSLADSMRLAALVPEIDVFVSGHSHETTADPIRVGETLIVQSGAFARRLGRLVIDVGTTAGEHRLLGHELLSTEKAPETGRGLLQLVAVLGAALVCGLLILL